MGFCLFILKFVFSAFAGEVLQSFNSFIEWLYFPFNYRILYFLCFPGTLGTED